MKIDTDNLAQAFNENPTAFMAAAGTLLIGLSKVVQAAGQSRGSHAFAKQVNHRIKMDKKRQK